MSEYENNHKSLGKRSFPINSNNQRTCGKYDNNCKCNISRFFNYLSI